MPALALQLSIPPVGQWMALVAAPFMLPIGKWKESMVADWVQGVGLVR